MMVEQGGPRVAGISLGLEPYLGAARAAVDAAGLVLTGTQYEVLVDLWAEIDRVFEGETDPVVKLVCVNAARESALRLTVGLPGSFRFEYAAACSAVKVAEASRLGLVAHLVRTTSVRSAASVLGWGTSTVRQFLGRRK